MAKRPTSPAGLYLLPAARVPIALVMRRRPHTWWHLMLWHLDSNEIEHGAWFSGQLYPRRADLSADGRLFCYFALQFRHGDFLGQSPQHTYVAVSKPPWLFALDAWPETGTYTRGYHFVERAEERGRESGPADRRRFLSPTAPIQYAAERRRGWVEHERCPPRGPNDMWDERRRVVLTKARPGGTGRLVLEDQGFDFRRGGRIEGQLPAYAIEARGRSRDLPDVVWAEWDTVGRLIAATRTGRVQLLDPDGPEPRVIRERDLEGLTPAPEAAPDHARRW
jgi:hypothetical protein